jgi:hypothetical protein
MKMISLSSGRTYVLTPDFSLSIIAIVRHAVNSSPVPRIRTTMLNMLTPILIPHSFCILRHRNSRCRTFPSAVSSLSVAEGGAAEPTETRANWPVIDDYLLFWDRVTNYETKTQCVPDLSFCTFLTNKRTRNNITRMSSCSVLRVSYYVQDFSCILNEAWCLLGCCVV